MAEVKNAFIKSKMNKDLDSRLLPSGEYRDGQNIQVSKSEGEDVGALENSMGNAPATTAAGNVDFSVLSECNCNLKSIGMYADTNSANIYIFLTDNTSTEYNVDSKNYIYSYSTLKPNNTIKLVEGSFLNFSQNNPVYGINILEDLLFWTDNRNQPRKINLSFANPNGLQTPTYYTNEDTISVAKYNPYNVINLYYQDQAVSTPEGDPNPNQNVFVSSLQDVTSKKLPDNTTDNMYYNSNWPGDPDYLEDKFITFSYRFIFTDGEQSIMAPFTQEAFIPKQDGYFLEGNEDDAYRSTVVRFMENKVNSVGLYVPLPFAANELSQLLDVSEIEILYKESDSLTVKVLDSVPASTFSNFADGNTNNTLEYLYDYQSRKPYKTLPESEIIRVYDKVPVKAFGQEVIGNRIVYSNFQDKHTPPPTIDYDVGVTPKEVFDVSSSNQSLWTTSEREYPMHTVKQNRNYQVGFVLSDRYGRQSTVILSPINPKLITDTATGIIFGGSTFYHKYTEDPTLIAPVAGQNNVNSWPGDSLKVLVNNPIPSNLENTLIKGYPGLWNGDSSSDGYNPLGWYSYKIVVKQTEQEYYNVYLPGILDGYPNIAQVDPPVAGTLPDPQGTIAHITLIGDNINKVPRNLTEVGPEQKQYGSEVELFGRVAPNRSATPTVTTPYYPQINSQTVVTISEQNNLFEAIAPATSSNWATVYQTETNPYVARISQGNVKFPIPPATSTLPLPIGSLQADVLASTYKILLGVFETSPVESLLDIFWETSTSGLISDLNDAAGVNTSASGFWNFEYIQNESSQAGSSVTTLPFAPAVDTNLGQAPMTNSTVLLNSVTSGGLTVSSDFSFTKINASELPGTGDPAVGYDTYLIRVVNPKRFRDNVDQNTFNFSFTITNTSPGVVDASTTTKVVSLVLGNIVPSIDSYPTSITAAADRDVSLNLYEFTGSNGATSFPLSSSVMNQDLRWSIQSGSQIPSTPKLIIENVGAKGILADPGLTARGGYSFNIVLQDANGNPGYMQAIESVSIAFGKEQINTSFGSTTNNILSKGLQSSGLFWGSNYGDYSLIETTQANTPSFTSSGSGIESRNAYSTNIVSSDLTGTGDTFVLDNNGLESINRDWRNYASPNLVDQFDQKYIWRNENYKPTFFDENASDSDNTLTKGTAYIKLNFRFKGWPSYPSIYDSDERNSSGRLSTPNTEDQLGVAWLAYMQYRPNSTSTWITATDVEGEDIRFGNTQQNQLNVFGGSFGENNFQSQGILIDSSTSAGYSQPNSGSSSQDYAVSSSQWVGSENPSQNQIPGSISSKVFVFGKDQGYENVNNDKFGEYRLLVKYPQRISGYPNFRMVPGPTTQAGDMSDWVLEASGRGGPILTDENIDVKISFGDFYYKENNTPLSFGYRVSIGSQGRNSASEQSPTRELWAREWSFKYVTQFYNDPELTDASNLNFVNNYWYSYSALTAIGNDVNTDSGSENSSIKGLNSLVVPNDLNRPIDLADRRWVAQFDGNGRKIPASATPCNSTVLQ